MTTYSFQGVGISFDDRYEPIEFLGGAELTVTAPEKSQISYETWGDGEIRLNLDNGGNFYGAQFTGGEYDDANVNELDTSEHLFVIDWSMSGQDYATTIFQLEIYDSFDDYEPVVFYFVVDGDPLRVASLSDYADIDGAITNVSYPTGDIAPGTLFSWSDLNPTDTYEDDTFYGAGGKDRYYGGKGEDWMFSSAGNDYFNGGKGFDVALYHRDSSGISVNLGKKFVIDGYGDRDKIVKVEWVTGSMYSDEFLGSKRDDTFEGYGGADYYDGKGGNDTVSFRYDQGAGGDQGINVDLSKGIGTDGWGNEEMLVSIENVEGTYNSDKFMGDDNANIFWGLSGKDKMNGGGGDDELYAGGGKDVMTGGSGADQFHFSEASHKNIIKDFDLSEGDLISFKGANGSIDGYDDLMANHVRETKKAVIITDDELNLTIKVNKVSLDDLTEDAFVF